MSTLSIKDMPRNEEMESNEMAAIKGGITFPTNVAVFKLPQTSSGSYTNGDPGSVSTGNSAGLEDPVNFDNGPGDFNEHSNISDAFRAP